MDEVIEGLSYDKSATAVLTEAKLPKFKSLYVNIANKLESFRKIVKITEETELWTAQSIKFRSGLVDDKTYSSKKDGILYGDMQIGAIMLIDGEPSLHTIVHFKISDSETYGVKLSQLIQSANRCISTKANGVATPFCTFLKKRGYKNGDLSTAIDNGEVVENLEKFDDVCLKVGDSIKIIEHVVQLGFARFALTEENKWSDGNRSSKLHSFILEYKEV